MQRPNSGYVDGLDLPNSDPWSGQPMQTWHCNGGPAQQWIQTLVAHSDGAPTGYQYLWFQQDYCCP